MIKPHFQPKSDIQEFFYNDFNFDVYEYIEKKTYLLEYRYYFEYNDYGNIDPLDFLNTLYFHFETIKSNCKTPLIFKDYFLNVDIPKEQLLLLFHFLTKLIDYSQLPELNVCFKIIDRNRELLGEYLGIWELCDEDNIEILPKVRYERQFEPKSNIDQLPPQPIIKQKSEQNIKLITFKNSETIEKIHTELKGYFPKKEAELLKALQGEQLSEILLFPHNQNKFVEVFRRLKYNGFLLNTDTETKNWICTTFQFIKKGFAEPQPFNEDTVWNNLNKGKGEPTKKERICITDWLPYKNPKTLEEEVQKEKR